MSDTEKKETPEDGSTVSNCAKLLMQAAIAARAEQVSAVAFTESALRAIRAQEDVALMKTLGAVSLERHEKKAP